MTLPHNAATAALADQIVIKLYNQLMQIDAVRECASRDYGDYEERGIVSNKDYDIFQGVDTFYNCNGEAEWMEKFKVWGDIKNAAHLEDLIKESAALYGSVCGDIRNQM